MQAGSELSGGLGPLGSLMENYSPHYSNQENNYSECQKVSIRPVLIVVSVNEISTAQARENEFA